MNPSSPLAQDTRTERDALGDMEIPADAFYGIHTARAMNNFAVSGRPVNQQLIQALVLVKKAAAQVNSEQKRLSAHRAAAIINACDELLAGRYQNMFTVDALQGGAGTSTHMNVNEVIANLAIVQLGGHPGQYELVHPLDDVNCCQSTNDVYPTALRIAAIRLLRPLCDAMSSLQEALQNKEMEYADLLKLGRTQLMDALPMMAGQGFGAYAKAIARDRWRLYKAEERLREIPIGGTAIGTGMNAPRAYSYRMVEKLADETGLGLCRSDHPMDPIQNMDVFVEVSGLLKSAAVNLLKISGDFRLLASGPFGGLGEYTLPPVQAGSSIMPGKVNPVMAEMAGLTAMRVIAEDAAITMAAASGQLELNAFLPLISESLLESLQILSNAVQLFTERCVRGLVVHEERCSANLRNSAVMASTLVAELGYDEAASIASAAIAQSRTPEDIAEERGLLTRSRIEQLCHPYTVTKPGIPGQEEGTHHGNE
ncbi:aspartate ammonia-lyase [Paenibacillus brasilensis]|uniref:Aspartate ammonia-lyase n=1 Tax=Paenibacillus brasilensis TaxID=128574 RepID=A0ABU0KR91_9BACL|nr:aspartate ammonia-lyase [Paenibacillus brasilensis]MDQ0491945.1 aspartate ammonia-lyase [Paenibacillus brasilensis]